MPPSTFVGGDRGAACPVGAGAGSASQGGKWDPLVSTGLKVGTLTLLHPSEYAKTLMQLGYEPVAPQPCKTWLGKPALSLPSVFKYIGVIKKRDGFLGLYAGLTPRVLGLGAHHFAVEAFNQYWPDEPRPREQILGRKDILSDEDEWQRVLEEVKRAAALRVTCVLCTQPFTVVAVRTMAQFVGKEDKYRGLFGGVIEIMNENGLVGFWSGWFPRAVGEVCLVVLSSGLTYLINRYVVTEKEMQQYTSHLAGFVASSLVYPFNVVSTCMAVSRSGLSAGYPPHMPLYQGWTDCYRHLSGEKQLKRGSSLFFRYYTGPQVVVGDKVLPVNRSVFKLE